MSPSTLAAITSDDNESHDNYEKMSRLQYLPNELLVKILCRVDYADLKQLFHVSRVIREATLMAKKEHLDYNTPTKIPAFGNSIALNDLESAAILDAPKKTRNERPRLSEKEMKDISVELFSSGAPDFVEGKQGGIN